MNRLTVPSSPISAKTISPDTNSFIVCTSTASPSSIPALIIEAPEILSMNTSSANFATSADTGCHAPVISMDSAGRPAVVVPSTGASAGRPIAAYPRWRMARLRAPLSFLADEMHRRARIHGIEHRKVFAGSEFFYVANDAVRLIVQIAKRRRARHHDRMHIEAIFFGHLLEFPEIFLAYRLDTLFFAPRNVAQPRLKPRARAGKRMAFGRPCFFLLLRWHDDD